MNRKGNGRGAQALDRARGGIAPCGRRYFCSSGPRCSQWPIMWPSMMSMFSEGHQQRAEMTLLRFVQAVEERLGRAGDRLEIGGSLGQAIRHHVHVIDRRGALAAVHRLVHGAHLFHARLGGVAHGGFERRPILFLVGRELQRRLHAGETRVEHERAPFRHRPHFARGRARDRRARRRRRAQRPSRPAPRRQEKQQRAFSSDRLSRWNRRAEALPRPHYFQVTSV